jgi:hypothetical protein
MNKDLIAPYRQDFVPRTPAPMESRNSEIAAQKPNTACCDAACGVIRIVLLSGS